MIKLNITNRDTNETSELSFDKDSLLIGRLPNCELFFDSASISRKHAEIIQIRGHYYIVDLESGNGTFHKGIRLKPNEKQVLESGDSIRIENYEIIPLIEQSKNFKEEQTDSGIIEIKMIKKVLSALDSEKSPSIEGISDPIIGKKVFFTDSLPELVIGRDATCDLSIDSTVISRRHAVIQKKWGGIAITNLKSKNGTFVNGTRVEEKELHDGDKIMLGDIEILFRNPHEIDLDALSKEYEARESPAEPPPAAPDDVATGFIDSQTGQQIQSTENESIQSRPDSISDQAKLSVEQYSNNENSNRETESVLDEITGTEALKNKPVSPPKNILTKDLFKKTKNILEQIFVFVKTQLENFSTIEVALLGVIILIVILSLIAFMVIFT